MTGSRPGSGVPSPTRRGQGGRETLYTPTAKHLGKLMGTAVNLPQVKIDLAVTQGLRDTGGYGIDHNETNMLIKKDGEIEEKLTADNEGMSRMVRNLRDEMSKVSHISAKKQKEIVELETLYNDMILEGKSIVTPPEVFDIQQKLQRVSNLQDRALLYRETLELLKQRYHDENVEMAAEVSEAREILDRVRSNLSQNKIYSEKATSDQIQYTLDLATLLTTSTNARNERQKRIDGIQLLRVKEMMATQAESQRAVIRSDVMEDIRNGRERNRDIRSDKKKFAQKGILTKMKDLEVNKRERDLEEALQKIRAVTGRTEVREIIEDFMSRASKLQHMQDSVMDLETKRNVLQENLDELQHITAHMHEEDSNGAVSLGLDDFDKPLRQFKAKMEKLQDAHMKCVRFSKTCLFGFQNMLAKIPGAETSNDPTENPEHAFEVFDGEVEKLISSLGPDAAGKIAEGESIENLMATAEEDAFAEADAEADALMVRPRTSASMRIESLLESGEMADHINARHVYNSRLTEGVPEEPAHMDGEVWSDSDSDESEAYGENPVAMPSRIVTEVEQTYHEMEKLRIKQGAERMLREQYRMAHAKPKVITPDASSGKRLSATPQRKSFGLSTRVPRSISQ